ncbi:hypothetical protein CTEN210_10805 [Chaetoceros tenuissimus]|uniref:Ubiquitin-like protease family profile domain-containing protein n=1 Tax=Chaetoceros tenuissimus TaxID=426638 RepID=A0AAD3D1D3_9STRA|nr:hypothetical protein CTEN210_10805 [Chaetoceros tenuissimus]
MNRKRSKIDHKRVFSNLLGKFNEKPPNFQNHAKPRNKQHVHKVEELKEDLQNLRESEIQRKEKRMQIYSEIEERKRVLATNQLKVMNLEETVVFHNMNPEEQDDYLDYTLECKKARLKEVMVDVDSLQDEFSALKVEYEMTSVECAKQIACARDMELDAKQKLENAKQCEHDSKSDLELLTTFRKTQKVYMDDMNRKNWKLHFNIPLEIRGSEYCSIDPKQPREEQIERNLQNLKQFCENQIEYARVKFEKGLEEKKLWEEVHAEEMEEVDQMTSQERHEPLSLASLFEPITGDLRLKVDNALFTYGDMNEILAVSGSDIVVRESFRSLSGGALDDKVVDFFFKSLAIRDANIEKQRNHFVESTFLSELLGVNSIQKRYSYRNVRSLSESVLGGDVFLLDNIFFPCKVDEKRWACAVVYMKEKKIQYFDSVKGDGSKYVDVLFQYLQDEWKAKKEGEFPDLARWDFIHGYRVDGDWKGDKEQDSGVFACIFADCLSVDIQFSAVFVESKMKESRKYIAASILKNSESLEGYSDCTLPEWWPEDQPKKLYHELRLGYWDEEIKLMFQKTFD